MYDEQESREHEIAPELAALERQLRGMTPAAPRVDRDQLMFAAGQAAGVGRKPARMAGLCMIAPADRCYIAGPSWAARRFWPAATFTMTAATLLLATMLVWQRQSLQVASQGVTPVSAIQIRCRNSRAWRLLLRPANRQHRHSAHPHSNILPAAIWASATSP